MVTRSLGSFPLLLPFLSFRLELFVLFWNVCLPLVWKRFQLPGELFHAPYSHPIPICAALWLYATVQVGRTRDSVSYGPETIQQP